MRKRNYHYYELVSQVHGYVLTGTPLVEAIVASLDSPALPLFHRFKPTAQTLRRWYLEEHPRKKPRREHLAAEVQGLIDKGHKQEFLAKKYGVTTRTIRNWLATWAAVRRRGGMD